MATSVRPANLLVDRRAGRVGGDRFFDRVGQSWLCYDSTLTAPFFADAAGRLVGGKLLDVLMPMMNRVGLAAEQLGHVLHAPVPQLLRFDRRITPAILLRKRLIQQLHVPLDARRIRIHHATSNRNSVSPPSNIPNPPDCQ
ncbi:MAG: hypothetical protein HYX69_16205, partial [Planctomycetia bacterium]|nr:hypothetical protein [Planctomycetia bacterium]